MAEFQAQAYICPVCHDDHSGDKPHTFWPTELAAYEDKVRAEVVAGVVAILSGPFDGTEGLDSSTLAWAIGRIEQGPKAGR